MVIGAIVFILTKCLPCPKASIGHLILLYFLLNMGFLDSHTNYKEQYQTNNDCFDESMSESKVLDS